MRAIAGLAGGGAREVVASLQLQTGIGDEAHRELLKPRIKNSAFPGSFKSPTGMHRVPHRALWLPGTAPRGFIPRS